MYLYLNEKTLNSKLENLEFKVNIEKDYNEKIKNMFTETIIFTITVLLTLLAMEESIKVLCKVFFNDKEKYPKLLDIYSYLQLSSPKLSFLVWSIMIFIIYRKFFVRKKFKRLLT